MMCASSIRTDNALKRELERKTMIKTVFVAFDGSDHAKKAVDAASQIAARFGARLVIGHVLLRDATFDVLRKLANRRALPKAQRDELDNYEMEVRAAMIGNDLSGFTPVFAPGDLLTAIGDQLVERAEATAKKEGVKKVETVMLSGDPAEAILKRAKREKADLIVLGTRGFGELKGLLLGSVSHKVAAGAHCACMTVK
jgi:nucleotide-binding universal stress UspA family protein